VISFHTHQRTYIKTVRVDYRQKDANKKQSEGLLSSFLVFYSTKKNRIFYKPLIFLEFIAHSKLGIAEVF